MVRQNLLTSLETCYEEGSEGLGGGREQTAVATEWPCLLSPNNAPSSRPRGVLGRAGPLSSSLLALPLFCRDHCASGQIVSLKCSGESPPGSGKGAVGEGGLCHAPGVEEPRWEARLGLGGCLAYPPTCRHSFARTEPHGHLYSVPHQLLTWAGNLLASLPALASDTPSPSSGAPQRGTSSFPI